MRLLMDSELSFPAGFCFLQLTVVVVFVVEPSPVLHYDE